MPAELRLKMLDFLLCSFFPGPLEFELEPLRRKFRNGILHAR